MQWCEQEGITVYAAPAKKAKATVVGSEAVVAEVQGDKAEATKAEGKKSEVDQASAASVTSVAAKKEKLFAKEAFRYDSAEKVYYCPQGKRLEELEGVNPLRHL